MQTIWSLIRKKYLVLGVRLLLAAIVSILLAAFKVDYFESFLYDLRMRFRPAPELSDHIRIVLIDKQTIKSLDKSIGYKEHTLFLKNLAKSHVQSVIYTIHPDAPLGFEDQYELDAKNAFIKGALSEKKDFVLVARSLPEFVIQSDIMSLLGQKKSLTLPAPLDSLKVVSGPMTLDKNILAKDSVSRRVILQYEGEELLHLQLAKKFNSEINDVRQVRGERILYDAHQSYIDFVPAGAFRTYKFEDLLNLPKPIPDLAGKIVLVGDDLNLTAKNYVATPYKRESHLSLVELHANMLDTLIRNSSPIQAPSWVDFVFSFLISLLTIHVVLSLSPLKGILVLLGTTFGFSLFSYLSFWPFGLWIEMAHPLMAIFICYYFIIPYRLIIESRRSWEYYQKHKLLAELEELKTNFISMMSHDLKTPLARIQGMSEVIQKDPSPLSLQQREALDIIRASSEDLLQFINTILNYAKIESKGVALNLQSKDVNSLLEEVIHKHEFLAKIKHIEIQAQLEPLFSIKIDPDLMKQVFSNLLENAIKYSPEGSVVKVYSLEVSGKIHVSFEDQGQGIPPEELSNIFMKFFRSRQAKASPVKGSGLGLYLAKYFTELHKGLIFVESTPGQGSIFRVEIPI